MRVLQGLFVCYQIADLQVVISGIIAGSVKKKTLELTT